MKKIIIIGDSGHAKVIADIVNDNPDLVVFAKLDDKYDSIFIEDGIIKGPINHVRALINENAELGVVIGIGMNSIRQRIIANYELSSDVFINAIHPSAVISPSARLGIGIVVMPNVTINADSVIGDHVIINSGSVIEHDCIVENYAHVSPLAVLTGGVCVGLGSHIGAGATIIPGVNIGKWTTVGAGTTVISDIEDFVTAVGNPARVIRREGLNNDK